MLAFKIIPLYQQLLDLPVGVNGEIIDGQLHAHPRPSGPHMVVESNLEIDIGSAYGRGRGGPGGWRIIIEPEVHFILDTEVTVPDIAGWKRERMPEIPQGHKFTIIPDWICEIFSPTTKSYDREVKLPLYAKHGVGFLWLVDPKTKTLETYKLANDKYVPTGMFRDDDVVTVEPFDQMTLHLGEMWN